MVDRKAHVKRIYQVDSVSKEIDKSTWIDVLRIDSTLFNYRALPDGMTRAGDVFKFRWNDDPNNPDPAVFDPQQENANAKRKTHRIILTNTDDSTFDGLWIIDRATINMRQGLQPGDFSGDTSQNVIFVFNNRPDTEEQTKRKVTAVTVVNNDLGAGGDDTSVGGAAINMDELKIVDWDIYKNALQSGKKDDSQKIYMEIVDKVPVRFGASAPLGLQNQIINYVFTRNEDIEGLTDSDGNDLFERAPDDARTVRADPLQYIVNVQLARVTGLIDQFMQKDPQWLLSFAFKKKSDDNTHALAVPQFGNNQRLPTQTISNDKTLHSDVFHFLIQSGGTVSYATSHLVLFSWKGFVIFQNYKLVPAPNNLPDNQISNYFEVPDPGNYTCFDSKGKPTTVDKLPKEDSKGVAIASATEPNTPGTWYMSIDKGLRKFDSNSNLMMTIGAPNSSSNAFPDTVTFDSARNQMRVVWFSVAPDTDFSGQGEIAWYSLDGAKEEIKIIGGEDFNGADCSRNGRIYGLRAQGGSVDSEGFLIRPVYSIEAYDYDGTHLFSIAPIGGFNDVNNAAEFFGSITCYGEDYIVTTTFKKTQGGIDLGVINGVRTFDLFEIDHERRIIYDAKTGAQVDEHDYGEFRSDSTSIRRQIEPVLITENIDTVSAYNIDQAIYRSNYFPVVDFKLPT